MKKEKGWRQGVVQYSENGRKGLFWYADNHEVGKWSLAWPSVALSLPSGPSVCWTQLSAFSPDSMALRSSIFLLLVTLTLVKPHSNLTSPALAWTKCQMHFHTFYPGLDAFAVCNALNKLNEGKAWNKPETIFYCFIAALLPLHHYTWRLTSLL